MRRAPETSPTAPTADPRGGHPLILYDGECGLCDHSVQFVLRHDPAGRFRFAMLQSPLGRRYLSAAGLPEDYRDSLILIDDRGTHTHSTAAVGIARGLSGPARLLGLGRLVPRALRDVAYSFVARHRYRWFGKVNACRLPTPGERARFLA